jgi:hypothetical protein
MQTVDTSSLSQTGPATPTASSPPTGATESDLLLIVVVTCLAVAAGLLLLRLFLQRRQKQPLRDLRDHGKTNQESGSYRGLGLLFGLFSIELSLMQLYAGFHSGQMEFPMRYRILVSREHTVFFGITAAIYTVWAIFGLLIVTTVFDPEQAKSPLIQPGRSELAWVAVFALAVYALLSF